MVGLLQSHKGRIDVSWTYDCKSILLSDPYLADLDKDGQIETIVATKDGQVLVIDEQGKLKATCKAQEKLDDVELMFMDTESVNSIEATPSVADMNNDQKLEIVFGSKLGVVYCFSPEGKLLWKFDSKSQVGGQVLLADINKDMQPEVIFGCMNQFIYALNNAGTQIWKTNIGAGIRAGLSIIPNANLVIACDIEGNVHGINLNGKPAWKFETGSKISAPPKVVSLFGDAREQIVVGSTDNTVYVIDSNGSLLWKYQTEGAIIAPIIVGDINNDGVPELVFGSCDNAVYVLNSEGKKLWNYHTDFWVAASPLVIDIDGDGKREVIAGSYDHNLYVLEGEGTFQLDLIPGLSGVVNQAGHYSDLMSKDPGEQTGKKIWQRNVSGIIVGLGYNPKQKSLIVCTKDGKINNLVHIK